MSEANIKYKCQDCGHIFYVDKVDFANPPTCPKCGSKNTKPWMDTVITKP